MNSSTSASKCVAACIKVIQNCEDIKYSCHACGTSLEGDYATVTKVVGECVDMLHTHGIARVMAHFSFSSRTDAEESIAGRMESLKAQCDNS
ncbi:hypothetical protein H4R34_002081 [Dimargaris verticillata]|uniref:Thiamine-binding protein domain-containing protein n=1 Tax=Dimargaris verticillata TaxID=2761393 RepID=A0A9W8B9H4_9FUNG|nr:hypothetical protein H4R34_002081 [Dimargaris verticillata]